jgi:NADH-quinone oxidoreductase subunit C
MPAPEWREVAPEALVETLSALRAEGFRAYLLATATERGAAFEVVHGVRDHDGARTVFVKTSVPKDAPAVPSATAVYAGADWYEREILDLFGIAFPGHPNPTRILMPDEYEGHPLRKDFPIDAPWGYRPRTQAGTP